MMFEEISRHIYRYIIEVEMLFLMRYKINPFEIMDHISMMDLQNYMNILQYKVSKEQETMKKKDLMKALIQIRDILNFITYKERA